MGPTVENGMRGAKNVTFKDLPLPPIRASTYCTEPCGSQNVTSASNGPGTCATTCEPPKAVADSKSRTSWVDTDLREKRVLPRIGHQSPGCNRAGSPGKERLAPQVMCPQHLVTKARADEKICPAHISRLRSRDPPQAPRSLGRSTGPQDLMDKLKEMQVEEDFRKENASARRQFFKYRGICGTLGNTVFTSTPMAPPQYQAKPPRHPFPGYPKPVKQHPQYMTTSGMIGQWVPYKETFPASFHPRNMSFTKRQAIGGMYEDVHLTTELNGDVQW